VKRVSQVDGCDDAKAQLPVLVCLGVGAQVCLVGRGAEDRGDPEFVGQLLGPRETRG
jgi:hypothetical protein